MFLYKFHLFLFLSFVNIKFSVEFLLSTDINVFYKDDWSETALNDAKKRSQWAIVDMIQMHIGKLSQSLNNVVV